MRGGGAGAVAAAFELGPPGPGGMDHALSLSLSLSLISWMGRDGARTALGGVGPTWEGHTEEGEWRAVQVDRGPGRQVSRRGGMCVRADMRAFKADRPATGLSLCWACWAWVKARPVSFSPFAPADGTERIYVPAAC